MTESAKKKTYFITGGGTGGHIYPAVAVADELVARGEIVFYVGNPTNLEYDIVKQKDYGFLPVNVHGMPRKLNLTLFKWMFELGIAVLKSIGYIKKYKPNAIFGTGGYVSAPALIAGKLMGVPFMMHDCDANPGLVTRKLSPYATTVSLAFESAKSKIKNGNSLVSGNPIRKTFKTLSKSDARKVLGLSNKLTLCIMGGSQGARAINDASVEILKKLSKDYDVQVVFQTGKKNFHRVIEQLLKVYPEYAEDKNLIIKPYFDDMVTVLKSSDIAVSRSGSLSLSEICASGIASILVPYPYAAADHQRKNAKFMEEHAASYYIEDDDVNGESLLNLILPLIEDRCELQNLQNNAITLAKYDAVDTITETLQNIAR